MLITMPKKLIVSHRNVSKLQFGRLVPQLNICFIGTDIGPSANGTFVRGHVNNVVRLSKELAR